MLLVIGRGAVLVEWYRCSCRMLLFCKVSTNVGYLCYCIGLVIRLLLATSGGLVIRLLLATSSGLVIRLLLATFVGLVILIAGDVRWLSLVILVAGDVHSNL